MTRSWMIVLLGLLAGCSIPSTSAPTSDEQTNGRLLVDTSGRHHRLLVYSFGSAPTLEALETIHADGVTIKLVNDRNETVYGDNFSEATDGVLIDYSHARDGVFRFVSCTRDCRDERDWVEFIETMIQVDAGGNPLITRRLILKAEKADPKRADKLVKESLDAIAAQGDEREDRLYSTLLHLRNMGVEDPDLALKALAQIKPQTDGAVAEMMSGVIDEVEMIKDLRQSR